jgi:hypothetical protein
MIEELVKSKPLDPNILYLAFHNSIKKVNGFNKIVSRKDIFSKLGRQFLVPKPLRASCLIEFERMGLLQREDRDNVKIVDFDIDIDKEPDKFIKKIGLCNY